MRSPFLVLVVSLAASTSWAQFNVRARGRFVVTTNGGEEVGVGGAVVRLMDSDSDYDVEMASGVTDRDGNFDLRGSSGDSYCADGSDCKRPDPYVRLFFIREGKVDVTDEIGFTHSCRTPVREETSGDIQFGNLSCSNPSPSRLFVNALRHISLYRDQIGEPPPGPATITIMYPSPSNYCFYRTVHMKSGSDTVLHELGHRVRHTLDGGVVHWNDDNVKYVYARASHPDEEVTNDGFAFNEGWADFHRFMHDEDPNDISADWSGLRQDDVEGFVSHELLRRSRLVCDGTAVGFKGMYLTLKRAGEGRIHSLTEFNREFDRRFTNCRAAVRPDVRLPDRAPKPFSAEVDERAHFLDSLDERAARPLKITGLRQSFLGRTKRLATLRQEGSSSFHKDALAAYRRALAQTAQPAEDALKDGGQAERELQARDTYVMAVAEPRLSHLRALKAEVAKERADAPGRGSASYFRTLEAQIVRQVAELNEALASRGKPDVKLPRSLAPEWLDDAAK
jgi:hypothetical protein